jgi:PGF-CTERM protein
VGVAVSGDYAYVASGSDGLAIVDVSDVKAPELAGTYDAIPHVETVIVSGDYAYVTDKDDGLAIVDVSDVKAPELAGSYDTDGDAHAVAVSGDYAYVADGGKGLVILHVGAGTTATTTPTRVGTAASPETTPSLETTQKPVKSPESEGPGFGGVFAVAGLLAIAYLMQRQRQE